MNGKLSASHMPGVTIGTNMKDRMRLVTFAEMRKIQKMMEQSHMGPGSTEHLKPFASEVPQRVPFGKRYDDKYNNNPGPGAYDFGIADKHTKSSTLPQSFRPKINYNSQKLLTTTEAGFYNPHKKFGVGVRKMTIGKRTQLRSVDDNPAPGSYNPDSAMNLTMPSSLGTVFK